MTPAFPPKPGERINWRSSIPFLALHLVPLLAFVTGVSERALVLCGVFYGARLLFITAGYHRYFSHRSYRTSRVVQFLLALGGTSAAQKGPLWWAAQHRAHHRFADTENDPHSPLKGFWWSHVGWILSDGYKETDLGSVADLARYPELRFLDRHNWIGPWALAITSWLVAGWSGLVVGFFLSTVLLWHATFTVNSLAHVFGRRRYATSDTSRNSAIIALLTAGEGWHNNHHHFPTAARQGFFWWELDPTWYLLRTLGTLRIVRDLRRPPESVLAAPRVRDGWFDIGMFRAYWAKATAALAASRISLEDTIAGGVASVGEARATLEGFVSSSLKAAEDLSHSARRSRRAAGYPG